MFSYLTAFEQGWVPSTYVDDKKLLLPTAQGEKQVNNWNFSHLGTITARKALSESVNTAAVRTVMDAGIDNMRDMSHRLGITDLRQGDCGPTITLGACEVKLVDMTFAFSVLANNGVMKGRPVAEDLPTGYRELDPVSVLLIQDADGNVIYQYSGPEREAGHRSCLRLHDDRRPLPGSDQLEPADDRPARRRQDRDQRRVPRRRRHGLHA